MPQMNRHRDVKGILLLDKPVGITSNAALQIIKKLYRAKKAGHTGSIDPLATGMLPICLGEATKFSQYILTADKTYQVVAKLGIKTASGDAEGDIVAKKCVPEFSKQSIEKVLDKFRGDIQQVPSMYSALKHKGQPLYKLARKGIEVERKPRQVIIYQLALLKQTHDQLELFVHCSKGTYVRSLIEDIGEALGCYAHVNQLRRLSVGKLDVNKMYTLNDLERLKEKYLQLDACLLPTAAAVEHYPVVELSQSAAFYLRQGSPVFVPNAPTQGMVRLVFKDERFLGVGEVLEDGKIAPRRLLRKVCRAKCNGTRQ